MRDATELEANSVNDYVNRISIDTGVNFFNRRGGQGMILNIGDYFGEYNSGVGYKRKAHSALHVEYFWEGYGTRAFFTKEELLAKYPNAIVD